MSLSLTDNRRGYLVERHDNLPRHPFDTENMYSICDDQVLSENMSSLPATDSGVSNRVLTLATLPLYLGGFLGPFGTMMVISIYPELRESFNASTQAVNWAFSGYMIPFALLLTVSGTIGERFGRRRVIRATFITYALASVLCVFAPTLTVFVVGRLLQGAANAFITPLLIAGLSEVINPSRLGRAVGVYTGFQAIGGAAAPFAGGVAAAFNWRIAFAVIAVVGLVLATQPPHGEPRPAAAAPPIKPLLKPRMILLWVAALTAAAGPAGLPMIVGLYLRDELFISSTATGFILLFGGISGAIAGPIFGQLLDNWGARRSSFVACLSSLAFSLPLGFITGAWVFAVAWTIVGALVGFIVVILQNLAAIAVPDNRGGALSSVLCFRFVGHGLGPLLWVPMFAWSPSWTFVIASGLGLLTLTSFASSAQLMQQQQDAE